MPETTTVATKRRTITIPIQKIEGFGLAVRSHLRDVLAPFPATDGQPFAISKVVKEVEPDPRSYLWTGNFEDGNLDNADLSRVSRDLMDRCGGAAFHLDRNNPLLRRKGKLLTFGYPTNTFDVIFLPQGAIAVATGLASSLTALASRDNSTRITSEHVQRVFQVFEGSDTSNHERLELLRASNAFLSAYYEQESIGQPYLGHHHRDMLKEIELRVISTN